MRRLTTILMLSALCGLPSLAVAQDFPAGGEKQPAPGEPSSATADSAESIEKFERIAPIEGTAPAAIEPAEVTELGEATEVPPASTASGAPEGSSDATGENPARDDISDLPAAPGEPAAAVAQGDLRDELQKLRETIEQRLAALERRLDEQSTRLETLSSTTRAAAQPAEALDGAEAQQRSDEVALLKQELEKLRSDITAQFDALATAPAGETTTAARPVVTVEAHRLRIHNTTGVEQPISINGVQWTVRADEWSSVPIPRGPVTVHRPGQEPLEVAAEQIDWQSDRRGYFFDYDLDEHRLAQPTSE